MYRSGVWVIGVALWCLGDRCLVFDGLGFFFFFFFFLVLMVDYGLLVVVVVSSV